MAVCTIVLSRHGSNLARPVIIHDIIHDLIYVPSTPYCGFFGVSPDGNCAYVHWGSFTSNSKSVRRAIWFTWFSEPHDSVYGTWQSQAVTHPLMNRARRRLTSVIEQISMSDRRIPYIISSLVGLARYPKILDVWNWKNYVSPTDSHVVLTKSYLGLVHCPKRWLSAWAAALEILAINPEWGTRVYIRHVCAASIEYKYTLSLREL